MAMTGLCYNDLFVMIVTTEQDWVFFTHSGCSLDQGLNTIPSWKPNDLAICAKY